MTHRKSIVYATLAGLSAAVAPVPAFAQQPAQPAQPAFAMTAPAAGPAGDPVGSPLAAQPEAGTEAGTGAGTLARLPATVEQLTLTGESAMRQFAVYVMPLETTKPAKLVLSFQSTVSIMPESSAMRVFVNDLPVGETRLGSGGPETLSLDLAPGMLQPGFNQVRIVVDQHHRVDCSITGTYELWTAIDPSSSGLSFEGGTSGIEGLEDLAALSRLDLDGITAIHAKLPAGASAQGVERAMSAVQSAILMGNFENPKIDFGPTSKGAALEVVVGTLSTLAGASPNWLVGNTAFPAVTFEPRTPTSPARLIVAATGADELDRTLANLAKASEQQKSSGTAAGLRALVETKGVSMSGGQVATLRDLGMPGRQFAGRFYQQQVNFQLPGDFYPADYADASLTLNAGYAANLAADAQLVVRANTRVVATIPLSSSKRGLIESQDLRVPLGALQPGKNVLTFEANLPNDSDAACDPAVQASPPTRFFISDTSSLTIPNFARVGHVPDLAAMVSAVSRPGGGSGRRELSILTKTLQPADIDIAATFVAKMTSSAGTHYATRFVTTMPHEATGDLIGFGTFADLPLEMMEAVRLASPDQILGATPESGLLVGAAKASEGSQDWRQAFEDAGSGQALAGAAAQGATATVAGFQNFISTFSQSEDVLTRLQSMGSRVSDAAFSLAGFDQNPVGDEIDPSKFYRPASDASLVIAQGPAPETRGAAWTVVAANDAEALGSNVALLTSTARWDEIGGAVSSMRGEAGTVQSITTGDERLHETQPRSLSNIRLIVAGWFSRHLESYVLALLLSCLALGVTTFVFVRSVGAQRR